MTTTTGTSLVPVADRFVFADAERLALVGFLAGCRDAYRMDLRLFAAWCAQQDTALCEAQRVDIECCARELEARGRARATVARRVCTVAGFYRYAEQEGLIERSPAGPQGHVRRPGSPNMGLVWASRMPLSSAFVD
jgi:integrase/recombinase XerD